MTRADLAKVYQHAVIAYKQARAAQLALTADPTNAGTELAEADVARTAASVVAALKSLLL